MNASDDPYQDWVLKTDDALAADAARRAFAQDHGWTNIRYKRVDRPPAELGSPFGHPMTPCYRMVGTAPGQSRDSFVPSRLPVPTLYEFARVEGKRVLGGWRDTTPFQVDPRQFDSATEALAAIRETDPTGRVILFEQYYPDAHTIVLDPPHRGERERRSHRPTSGPLVSAYQNTPDGQDILRDASTAAVGTATDGSAYVITMAGMLAAQAARAALSQTKPPVDERWTQGECGTFASALHQKFGYPIHALIEKAVRDGDETIIHAFCVAGDEMIDAHGKGVMLRPQEAQGTFYPGEESSFLIRSYTLEELATAREAVEDVTEIAEALAVIELETTRFLAAPFQEKTVTLPDPHRYAAADAAFMAQIARESYLSAPDETVNTRCAHL